MPRAESAFRRFVLRLTMSAFGPISAARFWLLGVNDRQFRQMRSHRFADSRGERYQSVNAADRPLSDQRRKGARPVTGFSWSPRSTMTRERSDGVIPQRARRLISVVSFRVPNPA